MTLNGTFLISSSLRGMVGRIMAPKEIHDLFPGTCEYITLHGKKGELSLPVELSLIIS